MADQQNGANSNGWVDLSKESNPKEESDVVGDAIVADKALSLGGNANTIPGDYKKELKEEMDAVVEYNTSAKGANAVELRKDFKKAVEDIIHGEGDDTHDVKQDITTLQAESVSIKPSSAPITGGTTIPKDYARELQKESKEAGSQPNAHENIIEETISASVASFTGGTTIPEKYREEVSKTDNEEDPFGLNENMSEPEIIPIQVPVVGGRSTIPPRYREELNKPEDTITKKPKKAEEMETIPKKPISSYKTHDAATKQKFTISYRPSGGVSYQTLVILFVIAGIIAASMVSKKMDELKTNHRIEVQMWNDEHADIITQYSGLKTNMQNLLEEIRDKTRKEIDELKQDLKEKKHMFDQQVFRVKDAHKLLEEKLQASIVDLEDEITEQTRSNKAKIYKEEAALKTWLDTEKEKLLTQTEHDRRKKKDSDKKKDKKEDADNLKMLQKLKEDNLHLQYKLQLNQATACNKCSGMIGDSQHSLKLQDAELQQMKKEHKKEMEMRSMNHEGQNFLKRKYRDRFSTLLEFIKENEPMLNVE